MAMRTLAQWKSTFLSGTKRKWSPQEDELLIQQIRLHGPCNWGIVALPFMQRTGKQCRERWAHKLSRAYTSEPWTKEEDSLLIQLQRENGNQWAKFRSSFPRRSTVAIKNRWATIKRRETSEQLPTIPINPLPTENYPAFTESNDFDIQENHDDLFMGGSGMTPDDYCLLNELESP
jgi:hypothetical protein